jgi:hypothetical protein
MARGYEVRKREGFDTLREDLTTLTVIAAIVPMLPDAPLRHKCFLFCMLYGDRPTCDTSLRAQPRGERGRAGGRDLSAKLRARHCQGRYGREGSDLGRAAAVERRTCADDRGQSSTLDDPTRGRWRERAVRPWGPRPCGRRRAQCRWGRCAGGGRAGWGRRTCAHRIRRTDARCDRWRGGAGGFSAGRRGTSQRASPFSASACPKDPSDETG